MTNIQKIIIGLISITAIICVSTIKPNIKYDNCVVDINKAFNSGGLILDK